MDDYIELLSELRAKYNCFDETEAPYYEALSVGIKAIREQTTQESILDKIQSEIEQVARPNEIGGRGNGKSVRCGLRWALEIIDKHRSESEDKDGRNEF